jgi:hypothetical protein
MQEFRGDWSGVLNPGKTEAGQVWIEVEWSKGRLTFSGVEGPLRSGNARGGCGQIDKTLAQIVTPNKGWTTSQIQDLAAVWSRWHLNDMRAGCEHQRALGWTVAKGRLSEPCPVCGYNFGSAWLREEVPAWVLDWVRALPWADQAKYPWTLVA